MAPSNTSKLKTQSDKPPKGGTTAQPLSQKQQMDLLSRNSELPKTTSISSLRDHLLAGTTASSSSSQQYTSYSSPRMGGGEQQHQASPMTPSANHPMTPESGAVLSPRVNATAARQDSQLSSGGQSMDQDSNYSRQNSSVAGGAGMKGGAVTTPEEDGGGRGKSGVPLPVENVLGMEAPLVGVQQSSPPLSNSLRGGGKSGGSNLSSPHAAAQSPLGGSGSGLLTPNVMAGGMQDGRSPAPGRPELLGFPARSPSFRSENQPSPLTEDAKMVSWFTPSATKASW